MCPVAALLACIHSRGTDAGPLFRFEDGIPLTRAALVRELRSAISHAGINPSLYSGHSLELVQQLRPLPLESRTTLSKCLVVGRALLTRHTSRCPEQRCMVSISSRLAASQLSVSYCYCIPTHNHYNCWFILIFNLCSVHYWRVHYLYLGTWNTDKCLEGGLALNMRPIPPVEGFCFSKSRSPSTCHTGHKQLHNSEQLDYTTLQTHHIAVT